MPEDFNFFKKCEDCQNLILFVHGITGDSTTWKNANGNFFPQLLLDNSNYIAENFDIATYEYFTALTDLFAASKEKYRFFKDLIKSKTHKKEKNLEIQELANNLSNHLRFTLGQYENIYVIAHSMGGLITKALITNELKEKGYTKIKFFASLAVPHLGAEKATLGILISNNLQIDNLRPVCDFIGQLNEKWIKLENKPTTKYFYGSYDPHVTKASACAIEKDDKDVISVAEDHNSISKPENANSIVVIAIIKFIEDVHRVIQLEDKLSYQKLDSQSQYDDELFVIKLIVAQIDDDSTHNAKELFLNAEYTRKLLKSKYDKKRFEELFDNIRQLYRDSYDQFLAEKHENSGLLLAEVHRKITEEDSRLLKSMIPTIKVFHKKGMLHQLANDENSDIWWRREKTLMKSQGE